jgi:D-sedoheptulose 7-phosphate isomerase
MVGSGKAHFKAVVSPAVAIPSAFANLSRRIFNSFMGKHSEKLKSNLVSSIKAKELMLESPEQLAQFERATELVVQCYQAGGRLFIAGNGGSAADAQHLAAEFVSKLARPRAPLPAEALTTDTSTITAIGNDFGFEEVFSRQVAGKMRSSDVFLGITTSGQSQNILRAIEVCKEMGIASIALSGRDGGKVKDLATVCITAPGNMTSEIQEVHQVIYHSLCACVEDALFPELA